MAKPRIHTDNVANGYAGQNERIVEFDGGLIAFRYVGDDGKTLRVELYRLDDNVEVVVDAASLHPETLKRVGVLLGVSPDDEETK